MKRIIIISAIIATAAILALSLSTHKAEAMSATGSISVSGTVVIACSVTTSAVVFPQYITTQPGNVAAPNAPVNVTCANGVPYTIDLDNGANGTAPQRSMKDAGANLLNYTLYWDAGSTQVAGSVSGGAATASITGNGAVQAQGLYGVIPGGQAAVPGAYTDTVGVTVTY
ncbi:MAG: spore coat U domain-containing protein [Deltaproteobacteria bacterium]|nr:spore coat U domain-containing protein [Deltaproteobacteria bacterium]